MIRPSKTHRSLRLESLETREMLTGGGPSAEAQYMLELINLARTNPQEAAVKFTTNLSPDVEATLQYYNVDLNSVRAAISSSAPRQPLAWNDQLAGAATWQSQDQANTGVQSHTGSDGSSSSQRMDRFGYTNRISSGENAYAYSQSVDNAMEAFLIDWGVGSNGHRNNLLQPTATQQTSYQEVGIGVVDTNKSEFGPEVITQDFGARQGYTGQLLGVAYYDQNGDGSYGMGEGQGNVQIDAVNVATGQTATAYTWDNGGGYQMALTPGTYKITAHVGGRVFSSQTINMGAQNVEVDYNLSQAWLSDTNSSYAQQTLTPQVIAPVTIPAPTQSQTPAASPIAVNYGNTAASIPVAPVETSTPTVNSWFSWSSKWFRT